MADLNEIRRKIKQGQTSQVSVTKQGQIKITGNKPQKPGETKIPQATFHGD